MKRIELLAPARDLTSGIAAIDCGADAVYIGAPRFGARKAVGNSLEDIARLKEYASLYDVKVYAALNTLLFEPELDQARRQAEELISARVDALIIQDPAYLMMGLEGVAFHASTQMFNYFPEGVELLEKCGFSRVILERALSVKQIAEIRSRTSVELEAFVHGAICVGMSGRCYMSRSAGPRSGNRGECAQPCRLRYDLVNENGDVLLKNKHLLSVKDLNLSGLIPQLLDAGVTSFKIEGRLKETEYVRNVVSYYRQLLDKEIACREGVCRASSGISRCGFIPSPEKTFSRGFTTWMADGSGRNVSTFDSPKATGEHVGRISRVWRDSFEIKTSGLDASLTPGDGVCFFDADGILKGTSIERVEDTIIFPSSMEGISAGSEIYRNFDQRFISSLRRSVVRRTIPVSVEITVVKGGVELLFRDCDDNVSSAFYEASESARNAEKALETIRTQSLKLGDTPFELSDDGAGEKDSVTVHNPLALPVPFIPVSEINALRRQVVAQLETVRKTKVIHAADSRSGFGEPSGSATHEELLGAFMGVNNLLSGFGLRELNVTNSLSRKFYSGLGLKTTPEGYDDGNIPPGTVLMRTRYCILRELGKCRKVKGTDLSGNLYLRGKEGEYKLEFDCKLCMMNVIKA